MTVVSGGAYGIDAAAHHGALAVGGPTLCVVANGVDMTYPPGNARLFDAWRRIISWSPNFRQVPVRRGCDSSPETG